MYRFGVSHLIDDEGLLNWWAATWTDYDPNRYNAFFAADDATAWVYFYNFDKVYQRAYSGEVLSGAEPINDGFFFLERSNGQRFYFAAACQEGLPHFPPMAGDLLPVPQCVRLNPEFVFGDLPPFVEAGEADRTYDLAEDAWNNGRFLTPFCVIEEPDGGWNPMYGSAGALVIEFPSVVPILNTGVWSLQHYQPYAWYGSPPDVISSVVARLGGGAHLDPLSFNLSSVAYTLAPWTTYDYNIHVARETGKSVADLLLAIVEHTADMLCFGMGGKLAMPSRQIPLTKPTLERVADGVLSIEHGLTTKYLFNDVEASHGSGMVASGRHSRSGELEMSVTRADDMAKSPSGRWTVRSSYASSVEKYGVHSNKRRSAPYLLGGNYLPHLTRWLVSSGDPRCHVTVKQDLRGAGYDNGWRIDSVDVDDNIPSTRRRMRCIDKKINFDSLVVTSGLLEEEMLSTDFGGYAYSGRSGSVGASRVGSGFDKGFDSDAFWNDPIFSGYSSGFSSGFGGIAVDPGFDSGFSSGFGPGPFGG